MGDPSEGGALQPPGTSARRARVLRILLVVSLLAPLTFAVGRPYTPPGWSLERPLGVPLTVLVSAAVLLVLVLLTARFGARLVDGNDKP